MIRLFKGFIANLRYLFILAVLALALAAAASLIQGIAAVAKTVMEGTALTPGSGALIVPFFLRAAFLYFLAVALGSLFLGDLPVPEWMSVRNLVHLRNKVLVFVAVIAALNFLRYLGDAQAQPQAVLYAGGGVFLLLAGIYLLARHGSSAGDEIIAREGNRSPATRSGGAPGRDGGRGRDRGKEGSGGRQRDWEERNREWLEKQKENLRFEKDTLVASVNEDISRERSGQGGGKVVVKPGPRRPPRRRNRGGGGGSKE